MGSGNEVVAPVHCIMRITQIQLLHQATSCRERQVVNRHMPAPVIEIRVRTQLYRHSGIQHPHVHMHSIRRHKCLLQLPCSRSGVILLCCQEVEQVIPQLIQRTIPAQQDGFACQAHPPDRSGEL